MPVRLCLPLYNCALDKQIIYSVDMLSKHVQPPNGSQKSKQVDFHFDEYIATFDIGQKLESMIMLFSFLAIHFGTDRFFIHFP